MNIDLKTLTRQHISRAAVMQLATQKDGKPWCCTVHFAADDALNLYWMSMPTERHSIEIGTQADVAAAIVVESRPDHPLIGVQIEGIASLVDDPSEIKHALTFYGLSRDEQWRQSVLSGTNENKLYRITPKLIQVFDLQNFPDNPKQQWRPGENN